MRIATGTPAMARLLDSEAGRRAVFWTAGLLLALALSGVAEAEWLASSAGQ